MDLPKPRPPYGIIRRTLKNGKLAFFLGAGASYSSSGGPSSKPGLPLGRDLARQLADEAEFPQYGADRRNLVRVASYYEETGGRDTLRAFLREAFTGEYQWGLVHEFLAGLDQKLLIVTTNYDDMIERAFQHHGRPYHLVVHQTDEFAHAAALHWFRPGATEPEYCFPNALPIFPGEDATIIYKMHGTINRKREDLDSFVITEDDYIDFLARMVKGTAVPPTLQAYIQSAQFLYLGYGLADWNLRVMMHRFEGPANPDDQRDLENRVAAEHIASADIGVEPTQLARAPAADERRQRGSVKSWAIQHRPSPLEIKLWSARGVEIYDMSVDEFTTEMIRAMRAKDASPPATP